MDKIHMQSSIWRSKIYENIGGILNRDYHEHMCVFSFSKWNHILTPKKKKNETGNSKKKKKQMSIFTL